MCVLKLYLNRDSFLKFDLNQIHCEPYIRLNPIGISKQSNEELLNEVMETFGEQPQSPVLQSSFDFLENSKIRGNVSSVDKGSFFLFHVFRSF